MALNDLAVICVIGSVRELQALMAKYDVVQVSLIGAHSSLIAPITIGLEGSTGWELVGANVRLALECRASKQTIKHTSCGVTSEQYFID